MTWNDFNFFFYGATFSLFQPVRAIPFTPQPLLCPHWSNDTQKIPFANHCSFDDFWQAAVQNWLWQIQTWTWQSPWDAFKRTLPKPAFFISRCVRSPSQEASAAISIFYRWWCLIYAGYFFVSKCICLPLLGSLPRSAGQMSCCIGCIERKLRY